MAASSSNLHPRGVDTFFLNISSKDDLHWHDSTHNPADFTLALPNSDKTNGVLRILPHTTVIPRMFPNVYAPDNAMVWYQRQVLELPTASPTIWFRTVDEKWTATKTLIIPDRIANIDQLLVLINTVAGPAEVWTFDSSLNTFVVTVTPPGPPIVFGDFVDGAHVTPPVTYANMAYIAEPTNTHLFDVLGLERVASTTAHMPLSVIFDASNPNTFDNLVNSNLANRNTFPLFDRVAHSYSTWASAVYVSPQNNAPNLAGPVVVHVHVTDLGDSCTVDAATGFTSDIITTMNMADVAFGTYKERIANEAEAEAIQYAQARNLSNFRVRLTDSQNRQLTLPRNFPFFLRLQMFRVSS